MQSDLRPSEFVVLVRVCEMSIPASTQGIYWVQASYDLISKVTNLCKTTVIACLGALAEKGKLKISRSRARNGGNGPNVFTIDTNPSQEEEARFWEEERRLWQEEFQLLEEGGES
jgi:hypothetical protein